MAIASVHLGVSICATAIIQIANEQTSSSTHPTTAADAVA